ncbi:MAG: helix-turn-helix domain-containing GNAT family N-acetyltransferase [Chloroflexota bacterium]|nr:helix-turn-helix domain-containing GNAT family N-acetyltransferase [Chloroflexota bacterium]
MTDDRIAHRAQAIRRFNRLYTQKIGVLEEGYLDTAYPLAAVRLVFELGDRGEAIAANLARDLSLDPGYLSRLVNRLRREGLIERQAAPYDRRQSVLSLTDRGREVFEAVNQRSQEEIGSLLESMPETDQRRLVEALGVAGRLLGEAHPAPVIVRREHRPGDMGWVLQAQGALYADEFGWDARFEALVAEIVAGFLHTFDPAWERCWIAERDGIPVGCVFVVRQDDDTAKLRLLLVDPSARGGGLGRTLVRECVRFARAAGYRRLVLWTNDVLIGARRIYEAEGFSITEQTPHADFGKPMVGELWELVL